MSPSIVCEELPGSVGERQSNDVRAAGEKRLAFGAASAEAASPMRLRFAITQPDLRTCSAMSPVVGQLTGVRGVTDGNILTARLHGSRPLSHA